MVLEPTIHSGARPFALARQYRARDFALQLIQVVAEGPARHGLPMSLCREGLDLILDPREPDALADVEISPCGESDVEPGGHRGFDQIQRAMQRFQQS